MTTFTRRPTFTQLAHWGLIAVVVLTACAVFTTVWTTRQGVGAATSTLVRGQADVFHDGIRHQLTALDHTPTDGELSRILGEYAPDGLRFIAIVDADHQIVSAAGHSVHTRQRLDAMLPQLQSSIPMDTDGIALTFFRKAPRTVARGAESMPKWMSFAVEFEPRVASDLHATAERALTAGAIASGALLAAAIVLVRWSLQRQKRERALEHERRLAGLGEMSAVLAHEIRNPLTSLKGNSQLLVRDLDDSHLKKKAQRVVDEAVRLETLANDLLEFVRSGEITRALVDPTELLREVVDSIDSRRITVKVDNPPPVWPLDGNRMRQVLVNVIENALQAGDAEIIASVASRNAVLIYEISDSGPGIPPKDVERIFEPFFTSRTQGTGLGLAVARRLVELHAGTLTVSLPSAGGAVFKVSVPKA